MKVEYGVLLSSFHRLRQHKRFRLNQSQCFISGFELLTIRIPTGLWTVSRHKSTPPNHIFNTYYNWFLFITRKVYLIPKNVSNMIQQYGTTENSEY